LNHLYDIDQGLNLFLLSDHTVNLPSNLQVLERTYDIIIGNKAPSFYFEDVYHDSQSMSKKMQLLYNQIFTKRKQHELLYDQPNIMVELEKDAKRRQHNMCRAVILVS
jgi:hypothetical protein